MNTSEERTQPGSRWRLLLARWFVPTTLALGWHALWWNWLRVENVRTRTPLAAVSVVHYAPASTSVVSRVGEWIPASPMSPLLFALPVRGGFSDLLRSQKVGVRPPLAAPASPNLALGPPGTDFKRHELFPTAAEQWENDIQRALASFPLLPDTEPIFAPLVTGKWVHITFDGDLQDLRWTEDDLPPRPTTLETQAWETVVFLDVDEDGAVRRLLFEQRTPSPLFNTQLERHLRGISFSATGRRRQGRLRIRAVPRTVNQTAERAQP